VYTTGDEMDAANYVEEIEAPSAVSIKQLYSYLKWAIVNF